MTSRVIPELQPMLALVVGAPRLDFDDLTAIRAASSASDHAVFGQYVPAADDVTTTAVSIPVDGGEIELRIHTPDAGAAPRPVVLHVHGGGWVLGTARGVDLPCRRWASLTGDLVVSVDYRLAPEAQYPIPLEDCFAALTWVVEHAGELGADADDIVAYGTSAGGNLVAGLALLCRDRGGPALVGQWLEVPALDLTLPDDDSLLEFGEGFGIDRWTLEQSAARFAAEERRAEAYASPLLADDLHGLPSALVTTAECDLLRDQGERYADRLRAAGVPVRYSMWAGHLHSTMSYVTLADSTREYEAHVIEAVAALRGSSA